MNPRPPKVLERIVAALIPAASREHVAGDLNERYQSPGQYLADALRTVPMVVLSRILRTTNPQQFLMESCALLVAYLGGAWLVESSDYFALPYSVARSVGWSVVALLVLLIRDAYASDSQRESLMTVFETAALVLVLDLIVLRVAPALAMPLKGAAAAAVWALILVAAARIVFLVRKPPKPAGGSLDDIPQRARNFRKRIRARNLRETLAGVLVAAGMTANLVRGEVKPLNPGFLLLAAALVFVIVFLHWKGSARPVPEGAEPQAMLEFYRSEVARQRDLLNRIWWWYLGPMVPGFTAILLQAAAAKPHLWPRHLATGLFFAVLLFGIGVLNRHGATKLQREIEALEALDRSSA